MKVYYHPPASKSLVKTVFAIKNQAPGWLRKLTGVMLMLMLLVIWVALMPFAWLLIKAGDAGHALGGWCGFDTREW